MFLNDDGLVRLEQYETITKEDLDDYKEEGNITFTSIDNILSDIKMWTVYEEDVDNKDDNINVNVDWFFAKCNNLEQIREMPILNSKQFNDSLIDFINGETKHLYLKLK